MDPDTRQALEELESRLVTILPEEYQACYEDVQPVSMGSAGLKYGPDGKVAWSDMWATFCDLAMAGGPPHKGTLLEPATSAEIEAHADRYDTVVREIIRGVTMVTGLPVQRSSAHGWVRLTCSDEGMAGWLVRAIVMENVSAQADGRALDLPAGPHYRVEKEIKNVVTVIAKTSHYWCGHMWRPQQQAIADLFSEMNDESPFVTPDLSEDARSMDHHRGLVHEAVRRSTGLSASNHRYAGWLGLECSSVRAAVWMTRTMVAGNVMSRREGTVLFVPLNRHVDPEGRCVAETLELVHALAAAKGVR